MFYTMIPELRGTLLVGQRIIWQLLADRDKKKSSSRFGEKIRSWRGLPWQYRDRDITIKPRILRELCPTSESRVAPRDTPWRSLSLSKFRHNGHTSTPSTPRFLCGLRLSRAGPFCCLSIGCTAVVFRFLLRYARRIAIKISLFWRRAFVDDWKSS